MARTEVYIPIPSAHVEGFTLDEIQGTKATVGQSPFREGHIPQFSIVSKNAPWNNKWFKECPNDLWLRMITQGHGRSYEFVTGKENTIIWADEYGNVFNALNTKGNNCIEPHLQQSSVTRSGYQVYGMQDSGSMVRVLRASDVLRANHIDTEAIIKVIEPAEVPIDDGVVPLPELKRRLALRYWNNSGVVQEMPKIAATLSDMTLYITVRGTQINERIADLAEAKNYTALVPMIKNAFRYVNIAEKTREAQEPSYVAEHFSIDSQDDVIRYFDEYLPKRIATNYASMHKLGLIHYFPHSANISTVGSIYDLDSVRGVPLGLHDNPVTEEAIVRDVSGVINGNSGFPLLENVVAAITGEGESFRKNFFKSYFGQMRWEGDIERFVKIEEVIYGGSSTANLELIIYYLEQIAQKHSLTYNLSMEEILEVAADRLSTKQPVSNTNEPESLSELLGKSFSKTLVWHMGHKLKEADVPDVGKEGSNTMVFVNAYSAHCVDNFAQEAMRVLDNNHSHPVHKYVASLPPAVVAQELESTIKQHFVRRLGWEDDIVSHIAEIGKLFQRFFHKADDDSVDYYLSLIKGQTSLDYGNSEHLQVLLQTYMTSQQTLWEKRIEKIQDNITEEEYEKIRIDLLSPHKTGLATTLLGTIEHDVQEQNKAILEKIESEHSHDTVAAIVNLFAKNTLNHIAQAGTDANAIQTAERNFYRKAIKDLGWENDIVPHLNKILDVFENFRYIGDQEFLADYLSLVTQQTGVEFPSHMLTIEDLVDAYLVNGSRTLEEILREAIKKPVSGQDIKSVIMGAYFAAGYTQDLDELDADSFYDHWSVHLQEDIQRKIDDYLDAHHGQVLASIEAKYDEDTSVFINVLFGILTEELINHQVTDDFRLQIQRRENQMELDVITLYIANPQLATKEDYVLSFSYQSSTIEQVLMQLLDKPAPLSGVMRLDNYAQNQLLGYRRDFAEIFENHVTDEYLRYLSEQVGLDLSAEDCEKAASSIAGLYAGSALRQMQKVSGDDDSLEVKVAALLENSSLIVDEDHIQEALYVELFREWGWENNVVEHIVTIQKVLSQDAPGCIAYYAEKVPKQLGWDFRMSESTDERIALFLEFDKNSIQNAIDLLLKSDEERADNFDVVDEAIAYLHTMSEEYSKYPTDRFLSFVTNLVSTRLGQEGVRLKELVNNYENTDEIYIALITLFENVEHIRLCSQMTDADYDRIDAVVNQQIAAFKEQYAHKTA